MTVRYAKHYACLVGILEGPAVHAVVSRVDVALLEPRDIAVLEGARPHGSEGAVPVKGLPRHLSEVQLVRALSLDLAIADLGPPFVGVWTNSLGMGFLIGFKVGTDERDLRAIAQAGRNGVSSDGIDGGHVYEV